MFVRRSTRVSPRLFTAAIALAVVVPAVGAQQVRYSPGTHQYRVTSRTAGTQEGMGQKQDFETSSEQLITVEVSAATNDTMGLTARIDSIHAVGPMGMPMMGLDQLHGFTVSAKLSPYGLVYSATSAADTVPNTEQLTDEMSRLLPRLRGSLATGSTWTDTTSGTSKQMGVDIKRDVISTFTVLGDTTVNGTTAVKIGRESAVTLAGSGLSQGQAITIGGTSKGGGSIVVTRDGVFMGSTSTDDVNITITLVANGAEIGVMQKAETRIDRVSK